MYILRVEFDVPDFAEWKKAFESDPAGRQKSGVSQYRIMRTADNPNHVMVDFDFENSGQAEAFLASLLKVWESVGTKVVNNPVSRIVEAVEIKKY